MMRLPVAIITAAVLAIAHAADVETTSSLRNIGYTNMPLIRPPKIERGPNSTVFRAFAKVTMICEASGVPDPSYYWEKDGVRMNKNDEGIKWITPGTFEITQAVNTNEGEYQCFATNKYGTAMSSKATLRRAKLDRTGDTAVQEYSVPEGSYLKMTCKPVDSYPAPTYAWEVAETPTDKSPIPVVPDQRIAIDQQGNLMFSNVQTGDMKGGKLYKCNLFNSNLDITVGGSYSRITVTTAGDTPGAGTSSPPKLEYSTRDVVALRGDAEAELQCFFSGNPTPQPVQWSPADPGKVFPRNAGNTQQHNILRFENVVDSNEGAYSCYPNGNKDKAGEVRLRVDVRPTWLIDETLPDRPELKPMDINVTEGGSHTFRCEGEGKPDLTYQWYIDAKPVLSLTPRTGVTIAADKKSMVVTKVEKERPDGSSDLMNVQCSITNKHGMAIAGAYLNVIVGTSIRTPPSNWTLVYTEPVIFNCVADSDPSTPVDIAWNWNGRPINYRPDVVEKLPNNSLKIITAKQDSAGAEFAGEYECVATNGYSEDHASAFLVLPAGPIPEPRRASILDMWWIFVIIAVVLLLLLLLLCCCLCYQRNKGDTYPVDEKERANGNDPEKELKDAGYQDYQRPDDEPIKGSRASLNTSLKMDSDDEGSLAEYGDIDAGKFNEDGSFIGQYTDTKPQDTTQEPPPYTESAQTPLRPGAVRVLPTESDV